MKFPSEEHICLVNRLNSFINAVFIRFFFSSFRCNIRSFFCWNTVSLSTTNRLIASEQSVRRIFEWSSLQQQPKDNRDSYRALPAMGKMKIIASAVNSRFIFCSLYTMQLNVFSKAFLYFLPCSYILREYLSYLSCVKGRIFWIKQKTNHERR